MPRNEAYFEASTPEQIIELVTASYPASGRLEITNVPTAAYEAILYDENILRAAFVRTSPFDKSYVEFLVDPTSILLAAKSTWSVISVTSNESIPNLVPISSIVFNTNGMIVTYTNGQQSTNANYSFYSNNRFDWYNIESSSYTFFYNENSFK